MKNRVLTYAETEALDRLLWRVAVRPGARLYALIDAARSPRALPLLVDGRAPRACLWDEPLPSTLAEAAPWLVEIEPGSPFALHLIAHAFGDAWGVFFESPSDLATLRDHLARFVRVEDERGRHFLFRFYDPRVLRLYLPTCTREELAAFFGPIRRFLAESAPPVALLDFTLGQNGLIARTIEVPLAEAQAAAD